MEPFHTVQIFCHGNKDGHVKFKNQELTFKNLGYIIRKELKLTEDQVLTVIVYCCYGYFQIPYYSDNTKVFSGFPTKGELEVDLEDEGEGENRQCVLTESF